jgi:hypothetical protein
MNRIGQLRFAILILGIAAAAQAQEPSAALVNGTPPTPSAQYKLIWSDEFDVAGRPRPDNWRFEHGFVRNQELQ